MKAAGGVSKKPEELKFFGIFAVLVQNIQTRPPRGNAHKFSLGSISSSICQPLLERKCFANRGKIFIRNFLYLYELARSSLNISANFSLKIRFKTIFALIGLIQSRKHFLSFRNK